MMTLLFGKGGLNPSETTLLQGNRSSIWASHRLARLFIQCILKEQKPFSVFSLTPQRASRDLLVAQFGMLSSEQWLYFSLCWSTIVRYRYALSPECPDLTMYIATRHARPLAQYIDATGLPVHDHSAQGYSVSPVLWTCSLDCK